MALEGIVSKKVTIRFASGSCNSWLTVPGYERRTAT